MKNKIDQLFETKEKDILSIFFTAGYPNLNDTGKILNELQKNDVDLIEIGIPYSDPLADGPVIQHASQIAIENGMNLTLLFKQLSELKESIHTPIIMMGYLNSVLQFGLEKFYEQCYMNSVSGVILPDLPIDEFEKEHAYFANKFNIKVVFLITPRTSLERIKYIDKISTGFIYVVSSNSITGNSHSNFDDLNNFYATFKQIPIKNKTLIGFGIRDHQSYNDACKISNGAIIGSAFISSLKNRINISHFIDSIKQPQHISI
jgi:tryptophan synthase alpha chain